MRNLAPRFKIFIVVCIAFFTAFFIFVKKEAIACELVGLSHFYEVSPNLYIDTSIGKRQQRELLKAIQVATQRVSEVYGTPAASPRIMATADPRYARLGFSRTGVQTSGFFRECIFLGSKGLNTDVIAHELVHAEVRHRTNLLVELIQLPAWFIEGTGVKVDYRKPFLAENIDVASLDQAKVRSVFFLKDFPFNNVESYQAALMAIEPMSHKDLYQRLERLNNGEQFEEVFTELF
ncbi:hypothetical protein [Lacimicrobium sp. SS2-24]|uniref:hypothetical protein n=1 Tax=Lacimicrobium sp. SS2-24 TaxID=2005569 RepID=UPI001FEF9E4D|nr:hypothetical protein [Lacimicrobium sp. SS2-24]